MLLRQIFDPKLAQYAYLLGCQRTGEALIVDPERDVDRYVDLAREEGLRITAVAETHIHADFLSGARELAEQEGARLYLSDEGGPDWRYEWALAGSSDADPYKVKLLKHNDTFQVGGLHLRAVHTPGHTPEHLSFLVTDQGGGASEPIGLITGDFVFVGDLGRPDLLESAAGVAGQQDPSARALFHSLDRFLDLPDFVQVWPAHGAGSACGKALGAVPSSTVGYEKRFNTAIDVARQGEETFVEAILSGQPEPPLYFATMKRLNKMGPPILDGLPDARCLTPNAVASALDDEDMVVLDTRRDRHSFMKRHLAGSLHTPLDRTFPTLVGSFVRPEQQIVLIAEEEEVEEATRDLVRIGFDHLVGFVPPSILDARRLAVRLRETPTINFAELEKQRQQANVQVLDVRGTSEFAEAHIPGALNIAHTRLLDRLDEVDDDAHWLVHCRSGARAAAATALLEQEGRSVTWVDDTFSQWTTQAA